jgi:hypothetical protein
VDDTEDSVCGQSKYESRVESVDSNPTENDVHGGNPVTSSPENTGKRTSTNAEQNTHSLVYTCVRRMYEPQLSTSSRWERSIGFLHRIHFTVLPRVQAKGKLERFYVVRILVAALAAHGLAEGNELAVVHIGRFESLFLADRTVVHLIASFKRTVKFK